MTTEDWIVAALLRLYPAAWRCEYGAELTDILCRARWAPRVIADVAVERPAAARARGRAFHDSGIGLDAGRPDGFVLTGGSFGADWTAAVRPFPDDAPDVTSRSWRRGSRAPAGLLRVLDPPATRRQGESVRRGGDEHVAHRGHPVMFIGVLMMFGLIDLILLGPRFAPRAWAILIAPLARLAGRPGYGERLAASSGNGSLAGGQTRPPLLSLERHQRIDARGAARGQVARERRDRRASRRRTTRTSARRAASRRRASSRGAASTPRRPPGRGRSRSPCAPAPAAGTVRVTWPGSAPSAIRTPISRVRCATPHAIDAVEPDRGQQQRHPGKRRPAATRRSATSRLGRPAGPPAASCDPPSAWRRPRRPLRGSRCADADPTALRVRTRRFMAAYRTSA